MEERKQAGSTKASQRNGSVRETSWQHRESEEEELGRRSQEIRGFEVGSEDLLENGANLDEDDSSHIQQRSPLEPKSPNWSSFADNNTPTKEFTAQSQKSQDVGFWEGEVVRELSVEEQIKRNRYYDEDEDEE